MEIINPRSEKPAVDIEFGSQDGRVEWRKKFGDNTVGSWESTETETNDQKGLLALKEKLLRENGLEKKNED